MNIIKHVTDMAETRLAENKTGAKTYATEVNAELAAQPFSKLLVEYFSQLTEQRPCRYMILQLKSGRFVIAFDLTELLGRHKAAGGYVGVCSDAGYLSY